MCVWPVAFITLPWSTCWQTVLLLIHGSLSISSIVARFVGSISNILPIIERLSRGSSRKSRHGPLIVSCFGAACCEDFIDESSAAVLGTSFEGSSSAFPDIERTNIDLGLSLVVLLEVLSNCGVPVVGVDTKSLYDVSVVLGTFHGNRRRVMQANMIAIGQMSVGCGSYLLWSYTSGAR